MFLAYIFTVNTENNTPTYNSVSMHGLLLFCVAEVANVLLEFCKSGCTSSVCNNNIKTGISQIKPSSFHSEVLKLRSCPQNSWHIYNNWYLYFFNYYQLSSKKMRMMPWTAAAKHATASAPSTLILPPMFLRQLSKCMQGSFTLKQGQVVLYRVSHLSFRKSLKQIPLLITGYIRHIYPCM